MGILAGVICLLLGLWLIARKLRKKRRAGPTRGQKYYYVKGRAGRRGSVPPPAKRCGHEKCNQLSVVCKVQQARAEHAEGFHGPLKGLGNYPNASGERPRGNRVKR